MRSLAEVRAESALLIRRSRDDRRCAAALIDHAAELVLEAHVLELRLRFQPRLWPRELPLYEAPGRYSAGAG